MPEFPCWRRKGRDSEEKEEKCPQCSLRRAVAAIGREAQKILYAFVKRLHFIQEERGGTHRLAKKLKYHECQMMGMDEIEHKETKESQRTLLVKELREKGMTQEDIAKTCGVSTRTIKREVKIIKTEIDPPAQEAIGSKIRLYNIYQKQKEEMCDAVMALPDERDNFYLKMRVFQMLDMELKQIEILRKISPRSNMETKTRYWGELVELARKTKRELEGLRANGGNVKGGVQEKNKQ